jgi:hypothetical protein
MKKNILFAFLMIFFTGSIFAQTHKSSVEIGDVFIIGEVSNNNYKYINFPRPNFIIKKGGMANYNNIPGEKVKVTSIKEKKDGSILATIELTSSNNFFNSHKYVTVYITEAITEKELLRI